MPPTLRESDWLSFTTALFAASGAPADEAAIVARELVTSIGIAPCNSPVHGHFVLPLGGREGGTSTNPLAYALPRWATRLWPIDVFRTP